MTNLKISGGSSEKYILNPFVNIFSGMAQVHSEHFPYYYAKISCNTNRDRARGNSRG